MAVNTKESPQTNTTTDAKTEIIKLALLDYLNKTGFMAKIKGTELFNKIYGSHDDIHLTKDEIGDIINEYGAEEIINEIINEEKKVNHRIKLRYCLYLAELYYYIKENRENEQRQNKDPEETEEIEDNWRK